MNNQSSDLDVVVVGERLPVATVGPRWSGGTVTNTGTVMSSAVSAQSWEPLVEDGREMGQVHWSVQAEGPPVVRLWRVGTEEGAELLSRVTGSDTFRVIEGEAELETPDGDRIELIAGGIYSFTDGFTATWRTRSPLLKFFVVA